MRKHLLFYYDISSRMKKIENQSLLYKIPMLIRVDGLKETLKYLEKKDKKFYEVLKKYMEDSFDKFKVNDYIEDKLIINVIQEIRMCQSVYRMLNKMILVNAHLDSRKNDIDSTGLTDDKSGRKEKNNKNRNTKEECKYLNNKSLKIYEELYTEVATINAKTVKSMVVGLGEASVKEVSMKKHHIFDLPYIPASSIKGIFRHFCKEDARVDENKIEKWFGTEEQEGQLVFVDLYPTNIGEYKIEEDVMTPHYSSYYTDDKNKKLPVDSDKIIPIKFSVLSNTSFSFQFYTRTELKKSEKEELKKLFFKCIHERLFGAKTSVGYGQVTLDNPKEQEDINGKIIEFLQENKNRKKIKIKFDTTLLSHGSNKKKIEFRITELKSAMRYWWRACNTFEDIKNLKEDTYVETMKEKEGKIFGNQKQISPLLLRDIRDEKFKRTSEGKKELIETNIILEVRETNRNISKIESENYGNYVDNSSKKEAIELRNDMNNEDNKGDTNSVESKKKKDLNFYENVLYLTSFLGGLGQQSRKGNGVFSIDGRPMIEKEEELAKEIKRVLELVSNTEWEEIKIKKNDCEGEGEENCYKIKRKDRKSLLNYPYIEEIYIGKPITKKEFQNRIENTIEKRVGDNLEYKFINGRFASPVYITCYRAKEGFVFPIVTILHNTTLRKLRGSEKKNNMTKKSLKEKDRKNWNNTLNKENNSQEKDEIYYDNYKDVCIETMLDLNNK